MNEIDVCNFYFIKNKFLKQLLSGSTCLLLVATIKNDDKAAPFDCFLCRILSDNFFMVLIAPIVGDDLASTTVLYTVVWKTILSPYVCH